MFAIVLALIWCLNLEYYVSSSMNITSMKPLRDPETILSTNSVFKMGFFSPTNSTNRYVGIWYNMEEDDSDRKKEVVWVANRDTPVEDSSGVLRISADGNLQVSNGENRVLWSSNVTNNKTLVEVVAKLQDTGNLVLVSSDEGLVKWQSFEHLTNSFLPETTITLSKENISLYEKSILRSWKSQSNPAKGRFSVGVRYQTVAECVTWDGDKLYWRSGPWNGNRFLGVFDWSSRVAKGFRIVTDNNQGTASIFSNAENEDRLKYFSLNLDGNLVGKRWDHGNNNWEIAWESIQSECDLYGKCGPFGICNPKGSPICKCLKGFWPKNMDEWSKGNWTNGCTRRTRLECETNNNSSSSSNRSSDNGEKEDGFWMVKNMNVPDYGNFLYANGEDDCRRICLGKCSCLGYAFPTGIGCMVWNNGSLIDLQQSSIGGVDLFIRLPPFELGEPSSNWKLIIVIVITIAGVAAFVLLTYYSYKWIRQRTADTILGRRARIKEVISHDYMFGDEMDYQTQFSDLPLFKFENLQVATKFFSLENKIGQGGFGPVYKGQLEDGKEIAIKRLSKTSGQGIQEFMNEVVLISKLQHKNLVRLMGCCVEKEENLLVYEFMPNGSLDALLFDANHRKMLDWKKRFNIVKGICRGLLYLHSDSRLKIIHRDLKPSNILLDEELNPKISDFGLARIFKNKQDQVNTLRIVGTYGYMSPEYAMEGQFSEKSDVYSLGVVLLEIVSGKKSKSFTDHESLSLLSYAWKLWEENNILCLIDPAITIDHCSQSEISKCIQLGLLCIEEYPEDRPTVATIISMLDAKQVIEIPCPKQPSFTQKKMFSANQAKNDSINEVSLTTIYGR